MKIEQNKPVDSATIVILLVDALLVAMIAAGLYYTFTAFGHTELREGLRNFITWIQGGAK